MSWKSNRKHIVRNQMPIGNHTNGETHKAKDGQWPMLGFFVLFLLMHGSFWL